MANLVFYRQMRYDGATRTGLELDGETIAMKFEGGSSESDPALLWYIDLRCEGTGIPDEQEAAKTWLHDQSPVIRDGLGRYSDKLSVGADPDHYSMTWNDFKGVANDVDMMIACSAIRRVDALRMASNLNQLRENWDSILYALEQPQEAEDRR